ITTEARSVENRTRLISHFDDLKTRKEQRGGWAKLWESCEQDLWDRGRSSPALITFLDEHPYCQTLFQQDGKRQLTAFVPGCGKGHDVALLACRGFDAWGLEVSQGAVDAANESVGAQIDSSAGPRAKVVLRDFFREDWETLFGTDFQGFDFIYDYIFLCALLPEMRKDWARRISALLSPTGVLVCLEFPMWKPLKAKGPPWGLKGVHWNILFDGGDGLEEKLEIIIWNAKGQGAFERVVYWKPPESFEQSRGEDMISIWKLKQ
ncbi:S-adenosyl-L-methionine-dependent methyltransferase, partial [Clathrospora elynae]